MSMRCKYSYNLFRKYGEAIMGRKDMNLIE